MYISRQIEKIFLEALKQFPVCLVTGPRQAGKSTLLRNFLKEYLYVTLDDPLMRRLANEDPRLFLSVHPAPLIIDEIQYAPDLLPYIKMHVDEKRHTYGQYVLTGSQIFQLMKGVSESLAGRVAIFNLYPLSWEEIKTVPGHQMAQYDDRKCAEQMVQGFYPEFFATPHLDKNLWFSSYLATYVERDVRNIKSITDLGRFQVFIGLLAARAGKLLNMSEIGKECGITQPTVRDWLSILEATYMIYLLKPYHNNQTKRLVKSPKLYFVDTGLLCYLLGIDTTERFLKSAERGSIFENMVVIEYKKRLAALKGYSQCFFYRTSSGVEVDLIIEKEGKIEAHEIKWAKTLSRDMAEPLSLFMKEHSVSSASVLSLHEERVPLVEGVVGTHWSAL
jgi:predicted AAA+ superfamily ATPase